MLLVDLLWLILSAVLVRAVWRVIGGVMEGLSGQPPHPRRDARNNGTVPANGVQMVRDPVCGTFIVPSSALVVSDGSRRMFFCSPTCRDEYRARLSTRSGRPDGVRGRTA